MAEQMRQNADNMEDRMAGITAIEQKKEKRRKRD